MIELSVLWLVYCLACGPLIGVGFLWFHLWSAQIHNPDEKYTIPGLVGILVAWGGLTFILFGPNPSVLGLAALGGNTWVMLCAALSVVALQKDWGWGEKLWVPRFLLRSRARDLLEQECDLEDNPARPGLLTQVTIRLEDPELVAGALQKLPPDILMDVALRIDDRFFPAVLQSLVEKRAMAVLKIVKERLQGSGPYKISRSQLQDMLHHETPEVRQAALRLMGARDWASR